MAAAVLVLGSAATARADNVTIQGAGATFPYPLYARWIAEYQKAHPELRINYQAIGSGGGIRQLLAQTVDFGASDTPMSDAEIAKLPGGVVHIPATLGAVVVSYNLPGVAGLRLDAKLLAELFSGRISRWNDPALKGLNAALTLPDLPVVVVVRADGSGTTALFTEYLAATNPSWAQSVGMGKSVRFPVGLGAKGNEGVTAQLKSVKGSIGYIELAYARQNQLAMADLGNRAGRFVAPSFVSILAAAQAKSSALPADLRLSILDAAGPDSYPIAAFSYLLLPRTPRAPEKLQSLKAFVSWALTTGQPLGASLDYAPLPQAVVQRGQELLSTLGKP